MKKRTPRADGWTMQRKLEFLAGVMAGLPVGAAVAGVGLSRTAAYALARRDPRFAAAWAEAAALARPLPEPEPLPALVDQLAALTNAALLHRLRRYNIGRGRRFLPA